MRRKLITSPQFELEKIMKLKILCNFLRARVVRGVRNSHRAVAAFVILFFALALRLTAQVFPPQNDDMTPSMGVFRLIVDPLFRPLLGPTGPPTSFPGYPGFHSSDGRLTSPMLIDPATTIGRSNPNPRLTPFPQPLGSGSWDVINGYGDYPAIPFAWFAAPVGTDEVLTEIKSFMLETVGSSTGQAGCTNTLVPTAPPGYEMVKAGTFAGVSPRSIGIVQERQTRPVRRIFPRAVSLTFLWKSICRHCRARNLPWRFRRPVPF